MKIPINCAGETTAPIDKLKNFQGNLKDLKQGELEKLKRSILKHGFSFPVFVWKNQILDGHQRVFATRALLKEGHTIDALPVVKIKAKDKTDAAEKLLVLNSRYAQITQEGLYEYLNEFDLDIMAFKDDIELAEINMDEFIEGWVQDDNAGLTDDDEVPEVPEEPKTKTGDLYVLGNHRLLCGDATKKEDVERLMDGQIADMVFTDPPYGVDYKGGHFNPYRKKLKADDTTAIYGQFLPTAIPFIDGPIYLWFADSRGYDVYNAVIKNKGEIHALIIWHKINATYAAMNAQYKQRHEPCLYFKPKGKTLRWCGASTESTLWEIKRDSVNDMHPTQKPVELALRAIKNHKAITVLDLFLGSGSTLIACEKTNRKCYGMEIDNHYCDVIVKRWEDYTGKKAELTKGDQK